MCDYSLYAFPNRLAQDGEELVANRFPSGCIGFVSISDASARECSGLLRSMNWPRLKPWFFPRRHDGPAAVCISPGTEIRLVSLDPKLQVQLGLEETENAVFIQLSAEAFAYRDGLQLRGGKRILLQELPEGQRIFVLGSTKGEIRSRDSNLLEEAYD